MWRVSCGMRISAGVLVPLSYPSSRWARWANCISVSGWQGELSKYLTWMPPNFVFAFCHKTHDTVIHYCFGTAFRYFWHLFPTSLWGFCFLACIPPAVVRRRPPSSAAALSHTHITKLISSYTSHVTSYTTHPTSHTTHLTHNSSHTTLISHTHTSQNLSHTISYTTHLTHLISYITSHTTHLTHTHTSPNLSYTHLISYITSHTTHLTHTHITKLISSYTSHLTSYTTHLTHNSSHRQCVAGAVRRAAWRRCGADSRRRGRGSLLRGRRSTQSVLKELRRGLSPAGPRLLFAWQTQYTEPREGAAARIVAGWAAAPLCVADAVHRASWRSCGADCRRLGRGSSLPGRRSTQSLVKELRRGLSPAGPRLLFAWQTQYTEPPEGARIVAGWAAAPLCVADAVHRASWRSCGADCRRLGRGSSLRGRRSTQSLLKELRRGLSRLGRGSSLRGRRSTQSLLKELRRGLSPAGPRLLFAWQTQYTEPPEGAAARIVAGWAAAPLCVADAVHRASWRSCGADCRRLGRGSSWQTQYTEPPEGAAARIVAGWAAAPLCVADAVHRASWRSCGADCRRLSRGFSLRGRRNTQSLLRELRRGFLPAGPQQLCTALFHTTHYTPLISHQPSHSIHRATSQLTQLISHQSSLTTLISNYSSHIPPPTALITQPLISQPLISHHLSYSAQLTQLISHQSSYTIHLTPLIWNHSSHTTPLTALITQPLMTHHSLHTTHLTPLVSHHLSYRAHLTPLISQHSSYATSLSPVISQHSNMRYSSYTTQLIPNAYSGERHKTSHVGLSGPFILTQILTSFENVFWHTAFGWHFPIAWVSCIRPKSSPLHCTRSFCLWVETLEAYLSSKQYIESVRTQLVFHSGYLNKNLPHESHPTRVPPQKPQDVVYSWKVLGA